MYRESLFFVDRGEGLATAEEKSHLKGVIRVDGAGVIGFMEVGMVEAIDDEAKSAGSG